MRTHHNVLLIVFWIRLLPRKKQIPVSSFFPEDTTIVNNLSNASKSCFQTFITQPDWTLTHILLKKKNLQTTLRRSESIRKVTENLMMLCGTTSYRYPPDKPLWQSNQKKQDTMDLNLWPLNVSGESQSPFITLLVLSFHWSFMMVVRYMEMLFNLAKHLCRNLTEFDRNSSKSDT